MSASPPPSDRDLSVDIVRRVMSEQFSHLGLHTIDYLGSGYEDDAHVIDGNLLVRFPRYADVAHGLERAEMVLAFVGSAARSALVVPEIILRGEPSAHFLHRFFAHEFIPGVRGNDASAPQVRGTRFGLGESADRTPLAPAEVGGHHRDRDRARVQSKNPRCKPGRP